MRRRTVHMIFASVALGCGVIALYTGIRLREAIRVNEAIQGAQELRAFDQAVPQARFAQALAWVQAGEEEAALAAYKQLSQEGDAVLRTGALYNLGNLHLREALKDGADEAIRSLPLIELAKQRYRELLRQEPADRDARYNLELALRLAPEADDPTMEEDDSGDPEERVISTLPGKRVELP